MGHLRSASVPGYFAFGLYRTSECAFAQIPHWKCRHALGTALRQFRVIAEDAEMKVFYQNDRSACFPSCAGRRGRHVIHVRYTMSRRFSIPTKRPPSKTGACSSPAASIACKGCAKRIIGRQDAYLRRGQHHLACARLSPFQPGNLLRLRRRDQPNEVPCLKNWKGLIVGMVHIAPGQDRQRSRGLDRRDVRRITRCTGASKGREWLAAARKLAVAVEYRKAAIRANQIALKSSPSSSMSTARPTNPAAMNCPIRLAWRVARR